MQSKLTFPLVFPECFPANLSWPARCATTGNKAFVKDITQWVFQEKGVLRLVSASHHRAGEDQERDLYRIKDDLVSTYA